MIKENKLKKVFSMRQYKGQTIFKINSSTLEISKADFSTLPIKNEKGEAVRRKKIITEDGYIYISAINKKVVNKKLIQMGLLKQ